MKHFRPERTKNLFADDRIPAAIGIACFVAMTSCSDATGPKSPPREPTVSGLSVLAAELHDAADVFARGVENSDLRGRAELAVNRLGEQLLAGKVASARAELDQARSLLANVDENSAIELAPVGLALDYIERRMNEILSSDPHDPNLRE